MNIRKNHYLHVVIQGYPNCQLAVRSNLSGGTGDNNYLIAQLRYGDNENCIKSKHITLSATELRQLFGVKKKERIMII